MKEESDSELRGYVRAKRMNNALHRWSEKLYIPVTLSTKNKFTSLAARYRMSQAELGAVIIGQFLDNKSMSLAAIRAYRTERREIRKELHARKGEAKSSGSLAFESNLGEFEEWAAELFGD